MAQFNLAVVYANTSHHQHALKWYRRAARQRYPMACCNLGLMYLGGQGVKQNYTDAYAWSCLAVEYGFNEAKSFRDQVAAVLCPADMSRAEQKIQKRRQTF